MSYSNGRIYVDTSKTPNEGVGIYDVQRALSTNRQDLGELCTHKNINKWARFKPVAAVGIQQISYNTIVNAHFGLDLIHGTNITFNDFATMVGNYAQFVYGSATTGTYVGWKDGVKYISPRGKADNTHINDEYYRLTDFVCKEKPQTFGYSRSADCMWRMAGSSTRGIGSDINPLVSIENGMSVIDLDTVPDYQSLDSDNDVFGAVNLQVNMANQTSSEFLSVSAPELLCSYGLVAGTVNRGVIIADQGGFVGYKAFETVPWATWRSTQEESLLYGEWCYFEFYTNAASETGRADYWLIPKFEDRVMFKYGGGSLPNLVFRREEGSGHVEYRSNIGKYAMYIGFAEITGQNLSNWYITVKVIKNHTDGTTSVYQTMDITSMSTYTSGYKWYYAWIGIDLGTIDNYGDSFSVQFYGRRKNVAESDRTLFTINYITLTS